MRVRRMAVFAVCVFVAAELCAAPTDAGAPEKDMGRLDPSLEAIVDGDAAARATRSGSTPQAVNPVAAEDIISVSAVPSGGKDRLLADLERLGLLHGETGFDVVSGQLPRTSLDEAAKLESLQFMRPERGGTNAIIGEGPHALRSDLVTGLTGAGVKVGILSNSFNCDGLMDVGQMDGDLPASIDILEDNCPRSDEGRGMAELVHDVAPGTSMAFHTTSISEANFAQGVLDLGAAGARVIADDAFYFAEPWYSEGPIARAVNTVTAQGVSYFASAGNHAFRSYEAPFSNSLAVGGSAGSLRHDFNPDPGLVETRQNIEIADAGPFSVVVQWDDPFGTHTPNSPATDIDVRTFQSGTNAPVENSLLINGVTGTKEPLEVVDLNCPVAPCYFDLQLELFSGPEPQNLKWVIYGAEATPTFATNSSTIVGHYTAARAMSVGAAYWDDTPPFGQTPALLEDYSSRGGINILFDDNGVRLPVPSVRQHPRFVGPDGTNNSFFGSDDASDADSFPNFYGTSASAPHIAGVAALMLQRKGSAKWFDICNALSGTAADMLTPGFDVDSGYGFVQADLAVSKIKKYKKKGKGPCFKKKRRRR